MPLFFATGKQEYSVRKCDCMNSLKTFYKKTEIMVVNLADLL